MILILDLAALALVSSIIMIFTGGDLTFTWFIRLTIGFVITLAAAAIGNGKFSYCFWWCVLALMLIGQRRNHPTRRDYGGES
jgi:hypothetical protein